MILLMGNYFAFTTVSECVSSRAWCPHGYTRRLNRRGWHGTHCKRFMGARSRGSLMSTVHACYKQPPRDSGLLLIYESCLCSKFRHARGGQYSWMFGTRKLKNWPRTTFRLPSSAVQLSCDVYSRFAIPESASVGSPVTPLDTYPDIQSVAHTKHL